MRKVSKLFIIVMACTSIATISCARKNATGCPAWGKANTQKTIQKQG